MVKWILISAFLSIQVPTLCAAWLILSFRHQLSLHLGTDLQGNQFQSSVITGSHVISFHLCIYQTLS